MQCNNANNESWGKIKDFPGGDWKSRWWRGPPHFWRLCPRGIGWVRARLCPGGAFWDWSEKKIIFHSRPIQIAIRCWTRTKRRSPPRCVDLKYPTQSQALATWLLSSTGEEVNIFFVEKIIMIFKHFLDLPLKNEQTNINVYEYYVNGNVFQRFQWQISRLPCYLETSIDVETISNSTKGQKEIKKKTEENNWFCYVDCFALCVTHQTWIQ